ncbi:MAG: hypothetical protein ACI9KE_005039 [Polyangiales bacterium]|jgi:hypothetical protein
MSAQRRPDVVEGDVRHATAQARRAKTAPLAGETHHHFMAPSAAREMDEGVLQNPASQMPIELFLDEPRQTALRFGALAESRPVLTHEERVLRSPRNVAIRAPLLGSRRCRCPSPPAACFSPRTPKKDRSKSSQVEGVENGGRGSPWSTWFMGSNVAHMGRIRIGTRPMAGEPSSSLPRIERG